MNPLCSTVTVATVLLAQPAVLTLKMQAWTVMEKILNLLQVCVVWEPENSLSTDVLYYGGLEDMLMWSMCTS